MWQNSLSLIPFINHLGGKELSKHVWDLVLLSIPMIFVIIADSIYAALYVARRNTAKADIALRMELDVITTVVLVGASIFGGRGTIIGTLLIVAVLINHFFAPKNAR